MLNQFHQIEVEIFSFCNRTCWFCPNSFIDRHSTNNFMPENTYLKVLKELGDANFSGTITYSRYNEPFADDIFFTRLEQARAMVASASLHTNSNGDYLNHEKLKRAESCGLNSLNIQLYPSKDFSKGEILRIYEKTQKRCKVESMLKTLDQEDWIDWQGRVGKMEVRMYGRNFKVNGVDRGGTLGSLKGKARTRPCRMPTIGAYIDWNGNVMPCCNVRSDIKEHEWYILGNVNESSLTDCLFNEHACNFRDEMKTNEPKKGACETCSFA